MKRWFSLGIAALLLPLFSCSSTKAPVDINDYVPKKSDAVSTIQPEPMTDKSAYDYLIGEKIKVGLNIGNTLDAWRNVGAEVASGEEVPWGNPRINQEFINGIKAAGFDIVRIPVTWMGFIGPPNDYHISEAYLKRVSEVVEYAHKAGLKVIINLHHDGSTGGTAETPIDHGWLSINAARKDEKGFQQVTFEFARVWTQIALYFKNHGDWLMFESFNEVHDGGWGWSKDFRANPKPQIDITNQWNQVFTDVVRGTGGNNATRYLVIQTYNSMRSVILSDMFVLPNDPAPNKQIISYHYYDPYEFGILGDQKGGSSEWGTDVDKQKVLADFAPLKEKFIDNKIPVIMGESGAALQLYPSDKEKEERARKSRLDYLSHVYGAAKKNGIIPIYWDNGATTGRGEKFGLLSRTTGQPFSPEAEAAIKAMINAAK